MLVYEGGFVVIQTTRFGQIELNENEALNFPEGLLGFNQLRKFILIDDPHDDIFAWLQSCENGAIAFPVLEPELFAENYKVSLAKMDLDQLNMKSLQEGSSIFCIVTIPDDPTLMTANMKAPIVINIEQKTARQCVLQDNQLAIREPIFTKLQQRVVNQPNQSLKSQSPAMGVAKKIAPAGDAQL